MEEDWRPQAGAVSGTATDAAKSLGMQPGTYRAYEGPPDRSKFIALDHQVAIQAGRKFKVGWQWLLTGEGSPSEGVNVEPKNRILAAMTDLDDDDQDAIAAIVESYAATRTAARR
jgi:hypothetical protein